MEIADRTKERSTVILAVLTLVVIGLTLLISTLQTFRHQRQAEEQHLYLTTRSVLLSIENSVRRTPLREGSNTLSPQTAEFFQALEQDGDVLFVGIVDEHGGILLTSPVHGNNDVHLPASMLAAMSEQGEWHGRLSFDGRSAYIYGKRLKPLRGLHMSLRGDLGPPGFLVVGVDMDQYLSAYTGFRKNAILQALYILAAALLTWGLGFSFLSRREQARKADALENFQAKLLDNLPDGLITLGADGMIRSANPAALHILKREAKNVLGRSADSLPFVLPCRSQALDTEKQGGNAWRHISHNGAHLEVLSLPLANDEENSCLLIIRDRTLLRDLEKSLADAEKLAAVGTLAAGVAHEVRNPLSALRGFAQYFVKKLAGRHPEEEYAKTMMREADRLNRVISDLLFLGRPKAIAPRQVNLEELVREITALLRFDLEQRNARINVRLDAPQVFADEDSLKQALLNLLLNSLEALEQAKKLPASGSLLSGFPVDAGSRVSEGPPERREGQQQNGSPPSLSLENEPGAPGPAPDAPLFITSGYAPGGGWIEVRDAGCGMTETQKNQAFEPFFTAKERGTGLGLALVQRTMLDHGGSARIVSTPGKGCAVRLFFPGQGRKTQPGSGEPEE